MMPFHYQTAIVIIVERIKGRENKSIFGKLSCVRAPSRML